MIFLNKECYGLFYLSYETNNQVFGGQFCYEERLTRMTFYIFWHYESSIFEQKM